MPYDRMPREDAERLPCGLRIFRKESGTLLTLEAQSQNRRMDIVERLYCVFSAIKFVWRITE